MSTRGGGDAPREPLILPLAPRRGWTEASRRRRSLAVGLVVAVLAAAATATSSRAPAGLPLALGVVVDLVVLVALPFCCSAAARVLRPDPSHEHPSERPARHAAAAVATAYGVAGLCSLATYGGQPTRLWLFSERSTMPLELLVGFVLGVATLAWGLVALLWRASRRWPGRVPWPGPLTLRPDPDDAV